MICQNNSLNTSVSVYVLNIIRVWIKTSPNANIVNSTILQRNCLSKKLTIEWFCTKNWLHEDDSSWNISQYLRYLTCIIHCRSVKQTYKSRTVVVETLSRFCSTEPPVTLKRFQFAASQYEALNFIWFFFYKNITCLDKRQYLKCYY